MNNKALIFFLFLFIACLSAQGLYGQNPAKLVRKAKRMIYKENFEMGVKLCKEALAINPTSAEANIILARTYLYELERYDSAAKYLTKDLVDTNAVNDIYLILDYANSLRLQNRQEEALEYYLKFKQETSARNQEVADGVKREVNENIAYSKNAIDSQKDSSDFSIVKNLGVFFNSTESEYTSVFVENDSLLIYNGRYKDFKSEKAFYDNYYMENLYFYDLEESSVSTFDESHDQTDHIAVVSKTKNSDSIVVYFQNTLWITSLVRGNIGELTKMEVDLSEFYVVSHGYFSEDHQLFVFSAKETIDDDMDIYEARATNEGWTKPEKIKGLINSTEDEDSPYLVDNDTVLYFSSKGHESTGGYDIFKSTFVNGVWSDPKRLSYPINSPSDDIYFEMSPSKKIGFLSSNRYGGFGKMDIYEVYFEPIPVFDCEEFENPELLTSFNLADSLQVTSEFLNYYWKFEDGSKDTGLIVDKIFEWTGTHYLNIDIYDSKNNYYKENAISYAITLDSIDFVGFSHPRLIAQNKSIELNAGMSYQNDFEVYNYHWRVNDEEFPNSSKDFNFIFPEVGDYDVTVQVDFVKNGKYYKSHCYSKIIEVISPSKYDSLLNTLDSLEVFAHDFTHVDLNENDSLASDLIHDSSIDSSSNVLGSNNEVVGVKDTDNLYQQVDSFKPKNIYFGFDSYALSTADKKELDLLINYLKKNKDVKLEISGHADSFGQSDYNIKLSEKRMLAVINYLKANGIEDSRIVSSKPYGESKPASPNTTLSGNDNPNGRKLNRRVEINLVR